MTTLESVRTGSARPRRMDKWHNAKLYARPPGGPTAPAPTSFLHRKRIPHFKQKQWTYANQGVRNNWFQNEP